MEIEKLHVPTENAVAQVCIEDCYSNNRVLFETERKRAGLADTDISLVIPENADYRDGPDLGSVSGSRNSYFVVALYPCAIKDDGADPREVIRHELAHIRNGDCDRVENWPRIIKELYRTFIAEPKARRYV